MLKVVAVSGTAGQVSQQVLAAAGGIGDQAALLRTEVDQFLAAVRGEAASRRHYERLPGNGAIATLSAQDQPSASAVVQDISRGGIAVDINWRLPAGTEVAVELPGAGGLIAARVVRADGKLLALVFRQGSENLVRIDRALPPFELAQRAA
jgi:methyl-accepting chemotaxis protein